MQDPIDILSVALLERFSLATQSELPGAPALFQGADKYVLASLIQKAIRRGDVATARRAGHQLLSLDPSRLWRRLRVTALEDIGIGDCDAAAELVAIATYAGIRRRLGGNRLALDYGLDRACRAVKDRTPDHLHSVVEREPGRAERVEALRHASDSALVAVLSDGTRDLAERAQAAATLLGHCEGDTREACQKRLAPVFAMFRGLGAPKLLMAACEAYGFREGDILTLYVLLAWSLRQAEGMPAGTAIHTLQAPDLIEGVPAYGMDPHHTRIGRRAVQHWRRSYRGPPPWSARQIGMALWNVEAAACDRTLDWPLGRQIRQRAYRADLLSYGVPQEQHEALFLWVTREHAALTSARRTVWRSAAQP